MAVFKYMYLGLAKQGKLPEEWKPGFKSAFPEEYNKIYNKPAELPEQQTAIFGKKPGLLSKEGE